MSFSEDEVSQYVIESVEWDPNQSGGRVALFDKDGNPLNLAGGAQPICHIPWNGSDIVQPDQTAPTTDDESFALAGIVDAANSRISLKAGLYLFTLNAVPTDASNAIQTSGSIKVGMSTSHGGWSVGQYALLEGKSLNTGITITAMYFLLADDFFQILTGEAVDPVTKASGDLIIAKLA